MNEERFREIESHLGLSGEVGTISKGAKSSQEEKINQVLHLKMRLEHRKIEDNDRSHWEKEYDFFKLFVHFYNTLLINRN